VSARRLAFLWGPVVLYAAAVFAASAQHELPPILSSVWDKALHAAAWAGLTLVLLRATHGGRGPLRLGASIAALLLALAYGFSDEFHQSFVRGRDASGADILADGVGSTIVIALAAARQVLLRHFAGSASA
jgi:VanZ family protein